MVKLIKRNWKGNGEPENKKQHIIIMDNRIVVGSNMKDCTIFSMSIKSHIPDASAIIRGGNVYPDISGVANFYSVRSDIGLMVEVELANLPNHRCYAPRFLGMHIHEDGNCQDNFIHTGMHYNPSNAVHPYHLGDLPPILNSDSYSYLVFYDSFLELNDIIGRSIIIHSKRDDFTTQPSGDSGDKIACGVIQPCGEIRDKMERD